MIRNILAVLVLSLTVAACDSSSTETNSNASNPAQANTPAQAASTPAAAPSAEASPAAASPLKAGDKVKATNGSFTDATVVSVDEKTGKVTVKPQGESKEKTVAIGDVVKQ